MNPQISSQYVNIPLTNYSLEKAPADMLGDTLAPVLTVTKDTGTYFEYGQEDFDVSGNDIRSPGAEAGIEGYTLIPRAYGPLSDHARKIQIPWEKFPNNMDPLDPIRDAVRKLVRRRKLFKEVDLVKKLTDGTKITQNTTPTNLWSDYANSTIASDFSTAFDTLMKSIQMERGKLSVVLSYPVFSKLIQHPEIKSAFMFSEKAILTAEHIRQYLEVKEVLVGNVVKNTSTESATPVISDYVWGKHAWVMYRDPEPSLLTQSGLYTLNLPGINQGGTSAPLPGVQGGGPWTIYHYQERKEKSDYVEISYYYQQYVMAPQAIYWFNAPIA